MCVSFSVGIGIIVSRHNVKQLFKSVAAALPGMEDSAQKGAGEEGLIDVNIDQTQQPAAAAASGCGC